MDTIFMNSKNSEISDHHRLLLNLTDKRDLRRTDICIALSNAIFSVPYYKNLAKKTFLALFFTAFLTKKLIYTLSI